MTQNELGIPRDNLLDGNLGTALSRFHLHIGNVGHLAIVEHFGVRRPGRIGGESVGILGIVHSRALGIGNGIDLLDHVGELRLIVRGKLFAALGFADPIAQRTVHFSGTLERTRRANDRDARFLLDLIGHIIIAERAVGAHIDDDIGIERDDIFHVGRNLLAHPTADNGHGGQVLGQVW